MRGKRVFALVAALVLVAAAFAGCGLLVVSEEGVVSKLKDQGYDLHFYSEEELAQLNYVTVGSTDTGSESISSASSEEKKAKKEEDPPKVSSALSAARSDGEWIKIYWFKEDAEAKAYCEYRASVGDDSFLSEKNVAYQGSEKPIRLLFE